ncbi:MAG: hypothetical protein D6791_01830 [Chloroflexi bacterium]|nr:MAG: hypothetical protein D6791_01830 [Chloroflexota bacterium]
MRVVTPAEGLPDELGDTLYLVVHERLVNPDDVWLPETPKVWTALTAVDRATGVELALTFLEPLNAIRFMKPALAHGFVSQGGKIAKYARQVAEAWDFPLLVEPTAEDLPALRRDYEFPGPGIDLD